MRIFITGGSGFIGSHVADALSKKHTVTVYDNFSSSVRKKATQIKTIEGDIRDASSITKAMNGHDLVIAMAAAHLRVSLKDPIGVHDVNATGTLTTLLAAKKNSIKRFVYVSSSEIYGSATEKIMSELHDICPTTVYGVSKYIGEEYTNYFSQFEGLLTTIVRPFNTYGPRSHFDGHYGEVIPRTVIRVLNNEPPLIFGEGIQTRDFTYVTDTAHGIITAALSKKTIGETLNIAYGKEITINHIAALICNNINPSIHPLYKPGRPNDVMRHAANTSKAKKLIQWNPLIPIDQGIPQYITWLKKTYKDISALRLQIPDQNW